MRDISFNIFVFGGWIPNPTLKFAPSGRWDAPSARPLAARYATNI